MSLLDPARIRSRAALVLTELQPSAIWKAALDSATLDSTPLLVTSLAPVDTGRTTRPRLPDYFIVSVLREGSISARFAHHAETGALLEAEGVRKPGARLRPYVDPLPIFESHMPAASADSSGPAAIPAPSAVWTPCRESTTRFAPFWWFQLEGRSWYVRVDGETFTKLSFSGRG